MHQPFVKALHSSCPQLDPEVHHGLGVDEGKAATGVIPARTQYICPSVEGQVSMTFVAQAGKEVMPGVEVVATLHHQVLVESSDLLDLPLLSIDTVVCQNNCSGPGECVEAS